MKKILTLAILAVATFSAYAQVKVNDANNISISHSGGNLDLLGTVKLKDLANGSLTDSVLTVMPDGRIRMIPRSQLLAGLANAIDLSSYAQLAAPIPQGRVPFAHANGKLTSENIFDYDPVNKVFRPNAGISMGIDNAVFSGAFKIVANGNLTIDGNAPTIALGHDGVYDFRINPGWIGSISDQGQGIRFISGGVEVPGKLGVGTNTPSEKLHVVGKALVTQAPTDPNGVVRKQDLDDAISGVDLTNYVTTNTNQTGIFGVKEWQSQHSWTSVIGDNTIIVPGVIYVHSDTSSVNIANAFINIRDNNISKSIKLASESLDFNDEISSYSLKLNFPSSLAANRTVALQDASGTIALTKDIPKMFNATASGDGSATTFSFAHGLDYTPTMLIASPLTADARGSAGAFPANSYWLTANATHVQINYTTARPSGTNNLMWTILVK